MMAEVSLAQALTNEHHEIDSGIEKFTAGLRRGEPITALAAALGPAMTALRRHIYLEEEFAFPPLKGGGLVMSIMVMEREHGVLWRQMDELEAALESVDDADRAALLRACEEMLGVLEAHNAKEEPILYPQLDTALTAEQTSELRQLIQAGQAPEGWVCARAQPAGGLATDSGPATAGGLSADENPLQDPSAGQP